MSTATYRNERPSAALRGLFIGGGILLLVLVGVLIAVTLLSRPEELSTGYGRTRGHNFAASVNGTSVLAGMFEQAGHRVKTASRLSPRVLDSDVMVWIPDSYDVPDEEVRAYFADWLEFHKGRTLVYIGRDFDATAKYWSDIHDQAEDQRIGRIEREAAFAETEHLAQRFLAEDGEEADWFTTDALSPPKTVKKLSGPWAEGIDDAKTEITLDLRLGIPKQAKDSPWKFKTLLAGDGEPLVTRVTRKDSAGEILIVQNGSFLLNYPLVNHEHRKLAGKLVEHCGPPGKVTFLQSGSYGLSIDENEKLETNLAFAVLRVWPINLIMLHAAMLGVLYCFASYPIFGRPQELPTESTADFGTHVTALGELLAKTKNPEYAQQRLYHYWKQSHRASGATHRAMPNVPKPKLDK